MPTLCFLKPARWDTAFEQQGSQGSQDNCPTHLGDREGWGSLYLSSSPTRRATPSSCPSLGGQELWIWAPGLVGGLTD